MNFVTVNFSPNFGICLRTVAPPPFFGIDNGLLHVFDSFSPLSQGLMFGYATDETEECIPLTVQLSHQLNSRLAQLRKSGQLTWARPDSKTQVILEIRFSG